MTETNRRLNDRRIEMKYVSPCQEDPALFDGVDGDLMTLAWGKQPKQEDPEIQRMQQAVAWCSYCVVLPECTALREAAKAEEVGLDSMRIDGILAGELVQFDPSPLGASVQKFLVDGKTKKVRRGKEANTEQALRQWDHEVDDNGCLNWAGRGVNRGNIYANIAGKKVHVRRYLWERAYGPIPGANTIGVTCGNERCGALDHIEMKGNS